MRAPTRRMPLVPFALVAALAAAAAAHAATCNVPTTSYPTIGAAARNGTCTLVVVAAGSYPEHVEIARDVAIQGAGSSLTFLQGRLWVAGAGNDATITALTVEGSAAAVAGCWTEMLAATGGATLTSGSDLRVLNSAIPASACRIFIDGFESGGTLAWSVSLP